MLARSQGGGRPSPLGAALYYARRRRWKILTGINLPPEPSPVGDWVAAPPVGNFPVTDVPPATPTVFETTIVFRNNGGAVQSTEEIFVYLDSVNLYHNTSNGDLMLWAPLFDLGTVTLAPKPTDTGTHTMYVWISTVANAAGNYAEFYLDGALIGFIATSPTSDILWSQLTVNNSKDGTKKNNVDVREVTILKDSQTLFSVVEQPASTWNETDNVLAPTTNAYSYTIATTDGHTLVTSGDTGGYRIKVK